MTIIIIIYDYYNRLNDKQQTMGIYIYIYISYVTEKDLEFSFRGSAESLY